VKLVALAMLAACTKPAKPPECRGVVEHLAKVIHAEPKGAWFDRDLRNCTDAPWTWAHKHCVIEAKNQKEIDACTLPVAPASGPSAERN
jgi:hypothetical protein